MKTKTQWQGIVNPDYWRFPIDFTSCAIPIGIHYTQNASPVVVVVNAMVPTTIEGTQFFLYETRAQYQVDGGMFCIAIGY